MPDALDSLLASIPKAGAPPPIAGGDALDALLSTIAPKPAPANYAGPLAPARPGERPTVVGDVPILTEQPATPPTLISTTRAPVSNVREAYSPDAAAEEFINHIITTNLTNKTARPLEAPIVEPSLLLPRQDQLPRAAGPVARGAVGVATGAANIAGNLSSMENVGLAAGLGAAGAVARAATGWVQAIAKGGLGATSAFFASQMGQTATALRPEIKKAWDAGDVGTAAQLATEYLGSLALGGAALAHAGGRISEVQRPLETAIESHNVQATKLLGQERAAGKGFEQAQVIVPEPIPVTVRGKPATIEPMGASTEGRPGYRVVDAESGKPIFAGDAKAVQEFLRSNEAKPVVRAEAPAPLPVEPPAVVRKVAEPDALDRVLADVPTKAVEKPVAAPVAEVPAAPVRPVEAPVAPAPVAPSVSVDLYHGSARSDLQSLQPGSMFTNDPEWAAGYTTTVKPDFKANRDVENFTGSVYKARVEASNPHVVEGGPHAAEDALITLARKALGKDAGSLKRAAEAVREKFGYDAIISEKDGVVTGAIPLSETAITEAQNPVEVLRQGRPEKIASNLKDILDREVPPPPAGYVLDKPVEAVPRSYEETQKAIDARETELEKAGVNPAKLFDPSIPGNEVLRTSPGWKEMPDDLAKLYQERDAIQSHEDTQLNAGLSERLAGVVPDAKIRDGLIASITETGVPPALRGAYRTDNWKDVGRVADKVLDYVAKNVTKEPEDRFSRVNALLAGTPENPGIRLSLTEIPLGYRQFSPETFSKAQSILDTLMEGNAPKYPVRTPPAPAPKALPPAEPRYVPIEGESAVPVEAPPAVAPKPRAGQELADIAIAKREALRAKLKPKEATSAEPKFAWQLTRDEFQSQPHGGRDVRFQGDQYHEESVREAVQLGRPVPSAVLAEYPDLAPKPEAPQPAPTPLQAAVAKREAKVAEIKAKAVEAPKEQRIAELQTELRRLETIAPRVSDGAISGTQLNRMSKRQEAQYQKNMDRRYQVEGDLRQLRKTDAEIAAEAAAKDRTKAEGRIAQIGSEIRFRESVGHKGIGGSKKQNLERYEALKSERDALYESYPDLKPAPAAQPEPVRAEEARTTPALGTPERTKLEADYKAADEASQAHYQKGASLRVEVTNSKWGSKKKELAEKKLEKWKEIDNAHDNVLEPLRKQSYMAGLEDAAGQTENAPLRIAARSKLSDLAEEARRKTSNKPLSQPEYQAIQKGREDALEDIRKELDKRVPALDADPKNESTKTEIAALSKEENADAVKFATADLAQRLMEHPLTAEKVDDHLAGVLHAKRIQLYKEKAEKILDGVEKEYRKATNILAGGDKAVRDAGKQVNSAYTIEQIDDIVAKAKEASAEAVKTHKAVEKDKAEARITLSKSVVPLSEIPSPRMNEAASVGGKKVWEGNVVDGGTILTDGSIAIERSAILDKKRVVSMLVGKKSYPAETVKKNSWDKIVASSTEALEEIGSVSDGQLDHAIYVNKKGEVIPLAAKRVRFIQSLTGATEVRGSTPNKGVAFYKEDKPVAILMPVRTVPDVDLAEARLSVKRRAGERGSLSLKPINIVEQGADYAAKPGAFRAAIDFMRPVESRIASEGAAGAKLAKKLMWTQDTGERQAAGRIVKLLDAGLKDLKPDDLVNLFDVLEGRADPQNKAVQKAFDGVRSVTDEMAGAAVAADVKVKEKRTAIPGEELPEGAKLSSKQQDILDSGKRVPYTYVRPFMARENYYPHIIPSTDTLKEGSVRKDVISNLVRQEIRPDPESAALFLEDYRKYIDKGGRTDSLEQYLVDTGQAVNKAKAYMLLTMFRKRHIYRQGSLEFARQAHLPFYDPNPLRVLPPFVHSSSMRLEQIRELGQANELVNKLIRDIDKAGDNATFVRAAVDRMLQMVEEPDTGTAKLARTLRMIQGFKLGLSFIPNASQGALNSLLAGDLPSMLAGGFELATKSGRRFAMESGASLEGVVNEMVRYSGGDSEALGVFLKAVGFTPTERANRVWAANAGATYAKRMLEAMKRGPSPADRFSFSGGAGRARKVLEELGMDPDAVLARGHLTPDEILMAAKRFSDTTQFRADVKDLPFFASTPMGKVAFQFKQYIYGQTRLLYRETAEELAAGRYGRAVRSLLILAIVFPMAGEVVQDIRSLITGRKRPTKALERYFDSIGATGAFGVFQSVIDSGRYGRVAAWAGGPTLGDASSAVENVVRDMTTSKHTNLMKQAFRMIPLFGPVLVNRVFPPRPPARSSAMRAPVRRSTVRREKIRR